MVSVARNFFSTVGAMSFALGAGCGPAASEGARAPGTAQSTGSGNASSATENGSGQRRAGVAVPAEECALAQVATAQIDPETIETIQPERRVPSFDITTLDCRNLNSGELVGKRPFILVFFSSWCGVCERKMPAVRAAAAALGNQVDFIGVALDEDETWKNVSSFVERHGLEFPIVRGTHYRSFSLGYDPIGSIPVVVVVGRDGVVVDLQVGYSPFDYNRLVGAAALAERVRPDALPLPSSMP